MTFSPPDFPPSISLFLLLKVPQRRCFASYFLCLFFTLKDISCDQFQVFSFANFNWGLGSFGILKSVFEPFLECLLHLDCHGVMEELRYYNEKKWNRHQEQDFCLCRVGSCSGDCHLLATNMNTNKVRCQLLSSSGNPKLKLRFQFHREFLWSQCARMCNAKFPPAHYR